MHFAARDLRKEDRENVVEFIENAPRYPTLLMRGPAKNIENFKGWWFGALEAGLDLRAVACIEGTATQIYATQVEAASTMAKEMLRRVKSLGDRKASLHQLMGDAQTVESFWSAFKTVNRKLLFNRKRFLKGTAEPAEPIKGGLTVETAQDKDLKLIYEFTADQAVEQWGFDPRKASPTAHEERCRAVIADGQQMVVKERGKPVFLCEVLWPEEKTAILDRLFVPRPFRVRKKMVSSALIAVTREALKEADEVLLFNDEEDKLTTRCTELAGYEVKHTYRLIAMRS